jgi:hypothetical protein
LSTGDPDASAFERIDVTTAHPARRYNYWLGGKDHFAADRASGDAIEAVLPSIRLMAIENRMSLRRAVRYVARQGIRQYLDIGTGIPAPGNTHEIAQGVDPTARTVYVDNDPIVLAHARALLTSAPQGTNAYLDADLREPCSILEHPDLKATLDFSEPITLMLVAVLHFIRDDEDPRGIVDRLAGALPPGSYVIASTPRGSSSRRRRSNSFPPPTPTAGSCPAARRPWPDCCTDSSSSRPAWSRSPGGEPTTRRSPGPRSRTSRATAWWPASPSYFDLKSRSMVVGAAHAGLSQWL